MLHTFTWLAWTPTAVLAVAALLALLRGRPDWTVVAVATRAALLAALALLASLLWAPPAQGDDGQRAAALVLVLVAFLGWIIADYSRRYLQGEPGQRRYGVALLGTLSAVCAVVASDNLAVLILAWSASSIGLHHLLTFYRERPAAVMVAHKKFLASRLAEACLVVAAALLYHQWGTLDLQALGARAAALDALPLSAGIAATLIAIGVLLKCAQLPLHGWLIQVMEAPTPVSALLHAGVVNLGGYVLIRLAPLLAASPTAQAVLVVVGGPTAVLAGLVMLTRVTIKVRLAWSTCSQMGLMVLECGLGLHDLALLHLVAHALYKAHAFLTAGEAVQDGLQRDLANRVAAAQPVTSRVEQVVWPALALLTSAAIVFGSALVWQWQLHVSAPQWIALAILACGLATLLWSPPWRRTQPLKGLAMAVLATQLYFAWHLLLAGPLGIAGFTAAPLLACVTLGLMLALYVTQAWVLQDRHAAPRLHDWAYAGFYLDERFTRLTLRLWPVHPTQR